MAHAKRGSTKFMTEGQEPSALGGQAKPQPGAIRKIVALLVSYSWKPEGEVFPIFEGRNLIGSALECEVCIGSDPQMSGKHATLIFRSGIFLLDDASSMNGTFLDEEDVLEKVRLGNYAHIRTGATQFVFIVINPEEDR
jgi:pSer/pThr/pTyr-binding forkhead associated (FHA) protein